MHKQKIDLYSCGSMDGRKESVVRNERDKIRSLIMNTFAGTQYDLHIRDPILKEKHKPGSRLSMQACNLTPRQIFLMDLTDVEESDIIYWTTADTISEGSEVEFAGAGWFNRWVRKSWFKKRRKQKLLIMIGKKRASKKLYKFQNMWDNVFVFSTHYKAMEFLKKYYKLGGYNAIRSKPKTKRRR